MCDHKMDEKQITLNISGGTARGNNVYIGKNNGTVALGGLIRETYTDSESGLPLLKDIPGIGYAFKSRDITKRRTELIIFLTPRIIRTDEDAQNAIHFIRREMDRLGAEESTQ